MAKRMILMLTVTVALVAVLGFVKFRQIQTAIAEGAAFQPPPEAVTTIVAQQEDWPATLTAIGTMAAVQGVTVSADLPGIVDSIAFESGRPVREGDVLAQLDTRQEHAQLAAVEAARDLARLNFERMRGLVDEGAISRADYDRAAAEQKETEARVGEIRATIARKTIRAPFSGILGIRQANLGQYLAGGDPIVALQSLHPIYVNFGVPQQEAGHVRSGRTVRVTTDDLAGVEFTGRVTAIDSIVDRGDPQHSGASDPCQSWRQAAAGHVRPDGRHSRREPLGRHAAGLGHQLRAIRRLGLRRHGPQGSERPALPRRAAAVREAREARAAIRSRSSRGSRPERKS